MTEHREWLTRAEVINLVHEELVPFHSQNLAKFDTLFGALSELKGSINTGVASFKVAAWAIGVLLLVLSLVIGVKH